MCGEHHATGRERVQVAGSSPHVRGALMISSFFPVVVGIIPACAGSTRPRSRPSSPRWDHPRMCGEHWDPVRWNMLNAGSSPHVRGAPTASHQTPRHTGIIPACAGSTCYRRQTAPRRRDHPRMCGEHGIACGDRGRLAGSSPHVRGAPPMDTPVTSLMRDHPRMCGEHTMASSGVRACSGSSPHVRGAHFENSIIPRKRKDNWLFFIQFRFENFLAFRYLLALLHPFLGVPTKDPSFASLGRLINCNPSQSTGDQSAPYTLKAICCSFLAE